ncbi:hypothetical protein J5Y09_06735 [Roseomonas sp. PWR1]|uniref:Uncharacterized protein n=1 Tax=Roseomonas nitratireducens TaxID=2820810 RepID=A0ABS4AQF1_9PROT|nr:hypothetical protein [Neoroseomonas nitratireducens]MBP0463599.1 hypothetical protein [Neoroseomonas nitratireducens]
MSDTLAGKSATSREGSARIAAQIEAFWLERGYVVKADAMATEGGVWIVRTNLVNGLPPPGAPRVEGAPRVPPRGLTT